ncbi:MULTISPECIES: metallophosphoesterase family protein [unclassified Sporolactobacillus]|uniref:metallophosphoesterase family protein n=1 Tax=unclassified Sporolactobacillus TaxID=2628533 RepID=UPI002367BB3B|nr:metallophosphoesterase family protein [Sporolactobacillus sp. CQH2019]MDD9147221.1 metallophosphoesterase family protein [Sporolactobacillus sp. CQH2019]
MRRLLAISDMHGEIDPFNALLDLTHYNPDEDLLILLGDYVDRGQDPKAVIKKARELESGGAIALKGNHEDMMEKALASPGPDTLANWAANGGARTLASYGLTFKTFYHGLQNGSADLPKELRDDLEWIQHLAFYTQTEHYFFVHAGVDPEKSPDETDDQTFLWTRAPFLTHYHGEKTVVFGHTPTMTLQSSSGVFFGQNNIIGIDGGCVFGGQLNCLELPSGNTYHV